MITNIVYKKLVEHMAEAVWMGDENEKTVYANPRFCNMLGYELDEIIGKESYMFRDPKSAEKVKDVNTTKRKKGQSSSYEGNLITKTGKIIPVLANGTPLPSGGTIGIMTDLSELKKQESLYKKLVENLDEAVWMGDKNERTIYANPKFCNMLGYELDEIIGEESYIFRDPKSVKKVESINTQKRKKGEASSYTGNLLTKSGKTIPVSTNGTPIPGGGTIGIMTDLRKIKEKEANEKILFNAVKYSTDAIIICDREGTIKSWNKGAQIIFGYKDEILENNIALLLGKKDIETILQASEVINKYELKGKHKNKSKLDVSITQTPIFDQTKSEVTSYLLICRDITNHRKVEEEIESKYKKIREVYQSIGIIKRQSDYIFDLLEMFENYHYDQKSIGDFIVTSVIMLTRVDACALRIYDKKSEKLKIVSNFGFSEGWEGKSSIRYKDSLAQKSFEAESPLKIIDINKEPRYQSVSLARKNNLTSLLLIPLKSKGVFIGSLSLYTKADKKLEIFENEFIEKYAKVIQIILANTL